MSHDLLRQQLREKSQMFKQYYTKYRSLHDSLAALADPAPADLERLQRQHNRLRRMKKEIWDEDRQLRDGLRS
jgi:RNA polymerase II elongation factor ELL